MKFRLLFYQSNLNIWKKKMKRGKNLQKNIKVHFPTYPLNFKKAFMVLHLQIIYLLSELKDEMNCKSFWPNMRLRLISTTHTLFTYNRFLKSLVNTVCLL